MYHQLTSKGIECIILAPTTMETSTNKKKKKNDKRDSRDIARCLAFGGYKPVYIPTEEDNAVREYKDEG